eukprot:scaffold1651_cov89-Skeletonema_dohrnii-CCMP3373.AAC.1
MLGCNVDVFGITSKLKEAHLYLIQLRERRVFWNASSVITPLCLHNSHRRSCVATNGLHMTNDGRTEVNYAMIITLMLLPSTPLDQGRSRSRGAYYQ